MIMTDKELLQRSYLTTEEADEHFSNTFDDEYWNALEVDEKRKALITATRQVDMHNFVGVKLSPNQPLAFPRASKRVAGLPDNLRLKYSDDIDQLREIPRPIKQAVAEQAVYIIKCAKNNLGNQKTQYDFLKDQGISAYSVDGASVTFKSQQGSILCQTANHLINPYLKKYGRLI